MIIVAIARNEIKRLVRDRVITALGLVMLVLLVMSVFAGISFYEETYRQHAEAKELARYQWENQGEKNPHSAAHYGTYAFKPVTVLTVFDPGVDRFTGVSLFLEAHRQNFSAHSFAEDRDASLRFAELTPSFIFAFLFPLFIILVGYRMVTSEKESGMYRFLVSQGVSKAQLVGGKTLALWGITLFLFAPFLIVGLGVLLNTAAVGSDLMRFALMASVWLLYFGVIIHLAIGVSALVKNSGTAMVVLLLVWITSTLLVPRLVTNVASQWYPVPNSSELYDAIRVDLLEGIDGHNPYSEHSAAFRDSVLHAHGVENVSDLPFNFRGLMLQEAEEFEKKIYDHHLHKIDHIHEKQLRMFTASSILSPTIAARLASMAVAGTDIAAFNHFAMQAEHYRIGLMRELNMDLKVNAVGDRAAGYAVEAGFFAENASFVYERPSYLFVASGQWLPLGVCTLWFVASLLFLNVAAGRKETI